MKISNSWTHKYRRNVDKQEPLTESFDWSEAQLWCNFTLLKPAELPYDVKVLETSMRPERAPTAAADKTVIPTWTDSIRAAHRSTYVGNARTLRIKQFLFDYAPPAFDHPGLWKSPRLSAFPVQGQVAWLGVDFRNLPGASIHLDKTMVELSVIEGEFSDDELIEICRGLQPVDENARQAILQTPLAELSYQRRHLEQPIDVPTGHWKHERSKSGNQKVLTTSEIPNDLKQYAIPFVHSQFELTSAFVDYDKDALREVDWVYESKHDQPYSYVRILVSPFSDDPNALSFPPSLETKHQAKSLKYVIRGQDVYHAFLDERYGQHEGIWQSDQQTVMVIVKPGVRTTGKWFLKLLNTII